MKPITHIDGLSGKEEALAIKVINEEIRTKLYFQGPQPKTIVAETVYFCPICKGKLEVEQYMSSPDDYAMRAKCPECGEEWES